MFFAFVGASPHVLIAVSISLTDRRAIFAGVSARAKRTGVTWLTRTSVHWAESSTATSRV